MAIARVQSRWSEAGSVDSLALAFTSAVTAGNTLVVMFALDNSVTGVAVTDSIGHTYVQAGTMLSQSTGRLAVYYVENCTGGANTVTVNPTNASANIAMGIFEISGAAAASFDKTAGTTGNSTTPNSGDTAATDTADEMVIGAMSHYADATTTTQGVTYTQDANIWKDPVAVMPLLVEYKVVSGTGVQAANYTTLAAVTWMCRVVTFRQAAAGGAVAQKTPYDIFRPMNPLVAM